MRPVSALEKGALMNQRLCANGRDPQLLDLIEIGFVSPQEHPFQPENHAIDPRSQWKHQGSVSAKDLVPFVEDVKGPLWANVGSSKCGQNDEIPQEVAPGLKNSLKLVRTDELIVRVKMEGGRFGDGKRKLRGEFLLAGYWYTLSVTDCGIEADLKACAVGTETVYKNPLLCLSLSEVFEPKHSCYKLIAGVIPTEL